MLGWRLGSLFSFFIAIKNDVILGDILRDKNIAGHEATDFRFMVILYSAINRGGKSTHYREHADL